MQNREEKGKRGGNGFQVPKEEEKRICWLVGRSVFFFYLFAW